MRTLRVGVQTRQAGADLFMDVDRAKLDDVAAKVQEAGQPTTYVGQWDVNANTPPLTTNPGMSPGKFYIIKGSGTTNITGTTITVSDGGYMISDGAAWHYREPPVSNYPVVRDTGPLLSIEDPYGFTIFAALKSGLFYPDLDGPELARLALTGEWVDILNRPDGLVTSVTSAATLLFQDEYGYAIFGITAPGVYYPPINKSWDGISGKPTNLVYGIDFSTGVTIEDEYGWAIMAVGGNGVKYPPDKGSTLPTLATVATTGDYNDLINKPVEKWYNRYTNVYQKIPNFWKKALGPVGSTADNPVRIIWHGNSLFAREGGNTVGSVVPANYPPTLVTDTTLARIWRYMRTQNVIEIPSYFRYDAVGKFTETGVFSTQFGNALWDDGSRVAYTRTSPTASASIAFNVPSGRKTFNFVDRTATNGPQVVTISVTEGSGALLVKLPGSTVFVEANGATFSQREVDEGAMRGNTIYQRRVEFKKVADTSLTVTLTKDATSDVFMYWGTEESRGDNPYLQFINTARAGHTLSDLSAYWLDDIQYWKPDLMVFEIPMINIYKSGSAPDQWGKALAVNSVWDWVWGDRPGNANPYSLKNLSNNWQDFEVLLVLPHISRQYNLTPVVMNFNPDGSQVVKNSCTASEVWNAVKALIVQKGDLAFVDMMSAFFEVADKEFNGNYYDAIAASSATGNTLTDDNTHPNNKGSNIWASHLAPIFTKNT